MSQPTEHHKLGVGRGGIDGASRTHNGREVGIHGSGVLSSKDESDYYLCPYFGICINSANLMIE
jgi:hypothetical protein